MATDPAPDPTLDPTPDEQVRIAMRRVDAEAYERGRQDARVGGLTKRYAATLLRAMADGLAGAAAGISSVPTAATALSDAATALRAAADDLIGS